MVLSFAGIRIHGLKRLILFVSLYVMCAGSGIPVISQLPPRYATLELFTNTPCPICGSQNPGLFNRLQAYEGQYHLISFYPGTPYQSCIFYQANIPDNTARRNFYSQVFGTPTVAINGLQFYSSSGVTQAVLDQVTGGTSWLHVEVKETSGADRSATITLRDHEGGSLVAGRLFAVIVEREIQYTAPNGETIHRNVFRRFLSASSGDNVDLSSGTAIKTYPYTIESGWQPEQTYVIAWLMDPDTKEIYNSGTRFDPDFTSATTGAFEKATLTIYPNPAADKIHIPLPGNIHPTSIVIYDADGRMIRMETIPPGDALMTLQTHDLLPGSYWAEVRKGNMAVARGRFVITR